MGADTFSKFILGKYKNAQEAFNEAVEDARYYDGHGGYTGTIAEKGDFVMFDCPQRKDPFERAEELIEKGAVDDKWGPAGCIDFGKTNKALLRRLKEKRGYKGKKGINAYLFFGWASS